MFSVAAGTNEETNLLALDDKLNGTGVRVEGLHDGTLFCRIESPGTTSVGELRNTVFTALNAVDAQVREGIHQIFLEQ